jgi:hypothetical protein
MTKTNQYQITIDVLGANTKLRKELFDVEQQLLEANAKIEELTTRLSDAETAGGKEMALHDADVIENMLNDIVFDDTAKAGTPYYCDISCDTIKQYIIKLRNSVKEGK